VWEHKETVNKSDEKRCEKCISFLFLGGNENEMPYEI